MKRQVLGVSSTWMLGVFATGALGCGRMDFTAPEKDEETLPMALSYPAPLSYHALVGETELQIAPQSEGVRAFSVSPSLPLGLVLDEITGELRGKPGEVSDRKRYVITGRGPLGEITAEIYLTALPGWKVTAMRDGDDDTLGMGVCASTAAGGCSLRAALQTANRTGSQRMILLPAGTITVAGELTPVSSDLVIAGAGVGKTIVRAASLHPGYRMMSYTGGRQVRLENATFQQFGAQDGGVLQVNGSRLEVFDVEFSQNASSSTGGVMCVDGGGQAYLENVTFLNNESALNEAFGGALNVSDAGTKVTVVKSTAIGNRAEYGSFAFVDRTASLEIVNSTITGNVATKAATLAADSGGSIVVTSSTVVGNTTTENVTAGLGVGLGGSTITLANTLVAMNVSTFNGMQRNCETEDATGRLISQGGNLFNNDGDGCKELLAALPQELNADLRLDGEAKDNGGRTKTIAIQAGSAAIDRGVGEHCPADDQRGVARKRSAAGTCDAGAYELE